MEYAACNVVYVDRRGLEEKLMTTHDTTSSTPPSSTSNLVNGAALDHRNSNALDGNIRTLLGTFSEVHVCTSGGSCMSKLSDLNQVSVLDLIPTVVLIDIPDPDDDQLEDQLSQEFRPPSPNSKQQLDGLQSYQPEAEPYGVKLLQWVVSEIQCQSLSKLVVPVAVIAAAPDHLGPVTSKSRTNSRSEGLQMNYDPFGSNSKKPAGLVIPLDQSRITKYLDAGAVDVLTSPLSSERLPSLAIHAYRAHKDMFKDQRALMEMKRGRKRSWVGLDDQKPYAYLREAMVSGLMDGICRLGDDFEPSAGHVTISLPLNRREKISASVGSWNFSAHDFTDDELLHAAVLMLEHALTMPELEQWRLSTEHLTGFLVASRSAYNAFVPYHNFRHVVDVLQASFHFLVQLGRLPKYPFSDSSSSVPPPSPIAELIRPFDALTLLITAIGHDVGHPGVNNAFLVTLNAPLAQLYNDRSVLEAFHCAAYSQILRRHWPAAFQAVEMRQLMINSILATDMGLHFDYMKKLGFLQDKLHSNGGTDGWNGRLIEDQRTLACSLLIKCADISNVARRYDISHQWTMILTDEFARQASMEQDLGIPSALFAPPVREIIELGKSQIGFMNMFAIPLFQGITDVMPAMEFCVQELHRNKAIWEARVEENERERARQDSTMLDGMFSPRAMSLATSSDAPIHQKSSVISAARSSNDSDLRIKAMLNKLSFAPTNGIIDESLENPTNDALRGLSTERADTSDDSAGASPSEPLPPPKSVAHYSSKPSQLQLKAANSTPVGSLDSPSKGNGLLQNGTKAINGVSWNSSSVTDSGMSNIPTSGELSKTHHSEKQRSSDTTDGSNSAAGDWASQATSATTGKMPLSPSTQGTSIMSEDSMEKNAAEQTPTYASLVASTSTAASTGEPGGSTSNAQIDGKGIMVMETVKHLNKKPSRFRMNSFHFWKRSKSASPPVPIVGREGGMGLSSEDGT